MFLGVFNFFNIITNKYKIKNISNTRNSIVPKLEDSTECSAIKSVEYFSPFIPYEKIFKMELDNCNFNGVSLGVPAVTMEMVISEIYRSKNDLSKPFRFAIGKNPKLSQLDYKAINIKQIPSFSSTFASVTFEDINYSLVSSINRTKYEKEETYSPIEETIKY